MVPAMTAPLTIPAQRLLRLGDALRSGSPLAPDDATFIADSIAAWRAGVSLEVALDLRPRPGQRRAITVLRVSIGMKFCSKQRVNFSRTLKAGHRPRRLPTRCAWSSVMAASRQPNRSSREYRGKIYERLFCLFKRGTRALSTRQLKRIL